MQEDWFSRPVFLCAGVRFSNHLGHEIPHGFRCLILHLLGGVGVGGEGEPRVIMPQLHFRVPILDRG